LAELDTPANARVNRRLLVSLVIGPFCGLISFLTTRLPDFPNQDFYVWWLAARAVLIGADPYAAISVAPFPALHGFLYPLPAALATIPLAWIPPATAGAIFVGVSCGALAFAVTQVAWWPLLMFVSGSMILSVMMAQWSPLLTLAMLVPSVSWIGILKPNIGLAVLASRPSPRTLAAMAAVMLVSLMVMPNWPREWLSNAIGSPVHFEPWRAPGGFLLFAALLRWRRPEGRMLAALAIVPSSPIVYEALPLFVIPQRRTEMLVLTITSNLMFLLMLGRSLQHETAEYLLVSRPAIVWLMYLPALAMVLRRPNEGEVPAWIERAASRCPLWLRGKPNPPTGELVASKEESHNHYPPHRNI